MDLLAVVVLLVDLVTLNVLFDELFDHVGVDVEEDAGVGVVLHDFEDEDLVVFEGLPVAVYQKPEEVQQF